MVPVYVVIRTGLAARALHLGVELFQGLGLQLAEAESTDSRVEVLGDTRLVAGMGILANGGRNRNLSKS